jgi:plasmid stability protein
MKNITVSVDDEVYHRARIRAAEKQTSVSALVRRFLTETAGEESDAERLQRKERETLERIRARQVGFSAGKRLKRDELYDRHALS